MTRKERNQWLLVLIPVALLFGGAAYAVLQARPRQVKLGNYPTQQAALKAAMQELNEAAGRWPRASSVTVHFRGPHPIPEKLGGVEVPENAQELVSYNRRLKSLLIYMNRPDGGKGWKLAKVVCLNIGEARLGQLAGDSERLLESPDKCGCKVEDALQIG